MAIKVIPLTEQDKEDFKQIQREIAFLADCNHPNVVRYLVRMPDSRGKSIRTCTANRFVTNCDNSTFSCAVWLTSTTLKGMSTEQDTWIKDSPKCVRPADFLSSVVVASLSALERTAAVKFGGEAHIMQEGKHDSFSRHLFALARKQATGP